MKSPHHKQLMKVLRTMATQEKWRKMPKAQGKVMEKSLTKGGNIKLFIRKPKLDSTVYVLHKNKNLYETASAINEGDLVSATTRRHLGKQYCVKLVKKAGKGLGEWL